MNSLIIDNHALVRAGLKSLIQKVEPAADVAQAATAQDALKHLSTKHEYDLILLDIDVPDMDGLTLLSKIRTTPSSQEAAIIIICSISDPTTLKQVNSLDVQYILPKDASKTDIIQRIRACVKCDTTQQLNKRQLQILRYLSQGMSNKEISQTIFLSEGTIKNHITQIFNFLGVSNRTQAIIEAERRNLTRS